MHHEEEFTAGEDLDFDQLNEHILKREINIESREKLPNPGIDTSNLYGIRSSPTKLSQSGKRKTQEISLKETPSERLTRLKGELGELKEELEEVVKREKDIKIANPETQTSLLREIAAMQSQIASICQNNELAKVIKNEGANTTEAEKDMLDLKNNLNYHKAEALLSKLRALQKADGKEGESIVYKINLKGDGEGAPQEIKVKDIESRITKLENLLMSSGIQNLIEETQRIKKNLGYISKATIEPINKKLNQVSQELETLNQKKQSLDLNDPRLLKGEKMYEAYVRLQRVSEYLPEIVSRLECVKVIHEESATIAEKLTDLKKNKEKINEELKEGKELLDKVDEAFGKNLESIEKDIKELQQRIEKISAGK